VADYFLHPSSVVDDGAEVGAGSKIWHFCHVSAGARLGPNFASGAFIGLHGSWNRSVATGYEVLRIPTVDGAPLPAEVFVTGWLTGTRGSGGDAWGRPVDVQVGLDGSLLVSDDKAGAIYRITYTGASQN
jgi:glucose/arabinose dehydrogenase